MSVSPGRPDLITLLKLSYCSQILHYDKTFHVDSKFVFLSLQSQIYEEIILGDRNYIYNTVLTL